MARKPRAKSSSGIYHIILRGINRQSIFKEDEDRLKFIETLAKYKEISGYRIFAYCLMDNHVHILLQEVKESVGRIMQRVSSSYVIWYNGKYERCGHLFQERFKSEPVETDSYFLTVLRYIHQNPIKAKIISDISGYPWVSYFEYMKRGQIIDKEYALHMFSDNQDEAIKRLAQFCKETNEDVCLEVPKIKVKMSDDDLRQLINNQFGIEVIKIGNEARKKQKDIVRVMKKIDGVSIRQIARVTGLSLTYVWKA